MSSLPPKKIRSAFAAPDKKGAPTFSWQLTHNEIMDVVNLVLSPMSTLPIVFVPGIMGSNLKNARNEKVWRLDSDLKLAAMWGPKGPGSRQLALHPDRVKVDDDGKTPKEIVGTINERKEYKHRGWGEVGSHSYHDFLLWLEETLNPTNSNPATWHDYGYASPHLSATPKPGDKPKLFTGAPMRMDGLPTDRAEDGRFEALMSDDLIARGKFRFPVYACGYNWLDTNKNAAIELQKRINKIISENNQGIYNCKQVIVVTHSMGGLVTRACAQLMGMEKIIAGVVHGVMPATGAAVAYRRCKVGMNDEDWGPGLVIGSTGQEVTAVFAQAPGALQLLPSQDYRSDWLKVEDASGKIISSLPKALGDGKCDPYADIYLQQGSWWGLVNPAWLSPREGRPITWDDFEDNIDIAKKFHEKLSGNYHPNTYVYYGGETDQPSFETIHWKIKPGLRMKDSIPQPETKVKNYTHSQVRDEGSNPGYVGGKVEIYSYYSSMGGGVTVTQYSDWELHCGKQDAPGDGTVPQCSGKAPLNTGKSSIKTQFKLKGFSHEGSYRNKTAQIVSLYGINKICGRAKIPT
jgi:hypothetical protein